LCGGVEARIQRFFLPFHAKKTFFFASKQPQPHPKIAAPSAIKASPARSKPSNFAFRPVEKILIPKKNRSNEATSSSASSTSTRHLRAQKRPPVHARPSSRPSPECVDNAHVSRLVSSRVTNDVLGDETRRAEGPRVQPRAGAHARCDLQHGARPVSGRRVSGPRGQGNAHAGVPSVPVEPRRRRKAHVPDLQRESRGSVAGALGLAGVQGCSVEGES